MAPTRPSIMSEGAITSLPAARAHRRLLAQRRHGHVVVHITGIIDDAVLSVGRVWIERGVRNDTEVRHRALRRLYGARNQPVRIPRLGTVQAAQGEFDIGKERDRRNAEFRHGLQLVDQPVDRIPLDTRHGLDRLHPVLALDDEHGIDEIVGGQRGFLHQPPREFPGAHAAHAGSWELARHERSPRP